MPAAVAVIWYWANSPVNVLFLLVSLVETVAICITAWQVIAYADIKTA